MTSVDSPTKLTTDELLYGRDPRLGILAVEPAGPGRVVVFNRDEAGRIETSEEPFQPWLLATRSEPWAALRSQPEVVELSGDQPLRFLVKFGNWQAYSDAARAARDSGERIFDFGSPTEQYLIASGQTLFKGMTFADLRRLQIDIETTGFDARDPTTEVIVVALRGSDGYEELLTLDRDERDLLDQLTERIVTFDPDVIEGHNLYNFDLPFLDRRAARFNVELRWGRNGSPLRISPNQQRFKAGPLSLPFTPAHIHGRHIIDTYQQIQRYDSAGRLTSYGLKNAVEALGLTRPDREFVPGDQIRDLWHSNRDRLLRYALDDVRDVDTLGRLTIPTEFYQAQLIPRSLQSAATAGPGGKINDLMVRAYVAQKHSLPLARPSQDYPGGFAEILEVGAFSPVVKCDVESLYPSIMLSEQITSQSDSLGSYLPMLGELTRRRLHAKARSRDTFGEERAMWEGMQSSFKVLINSFYGYLGFSAALFNDYEAARRVTLAGQDIIKATVATLRASGATPIEVDTDGVYFVPPAKVQSEAEERQYIDQIGATLPRGIRLAHDGRYQAMLSLRLKTYGLLGYDGTVQLKGSALRSRKMEPCFRAFLQDAALAFMSGDREKPRELYFALADRIRNRDLDITEFAQWSMLNDAGASQPRLKRLLDRLNPKPKVGERLELYERDDGELALREEYAENENIGYLLRRLHETAARFDALFPDQAAFLASFPPLTMRTDLEMAKVQEASKQLTFF